MHLLDRSLSLAGSILDWTTPTKGPQPSPYKHSRQASNTGPFNTTREEARHARARIRAERKRQQTV